jgi:23S rRNA (cytidine2498-2'-O)-methyltransferase
MHTLPACPATLEAAMGYQNILLYCRPGFENECGREFADRSKSFGNGMVVSSNQNSGHVLFSFSDDPSAQECVRRLRLSSLVFSRQMVLTSDCIGPLAPGDRVAPLVSEIQKAGSTFVDLFIETADTNEAKQLSGLCTKLLPPLSGALEKEGLLDRPAKEGAADGKLLHVFFIATDRAYAGYSFVNNSSPWRMGIPRLRFPAGAPSRSALKLEEAFCVFLPAEDRARLLKPGMSAIDLGASPGGWTWLLASRGIHVTAVDNGRLDRRLLQNGLVRHVRQDGFSFSPSRPADWMVCDIVEQPSRIARLAAQWIARQWCRRTVFTLKLPMKKRYEEILRCKDSITAEMEGLGQRYELCIKQLYHDREEVTAYMRVL